MNKNNNKKVVNISKKTFITAVTVLAVFLIVSAILTYILPKGHFAEETVGEKVIVDYSHFVPSDSRGGVAVYKVIFAPILLFFAEGFIQPLMLILFLLVVAGQFQVMGDAGGMFAIVSRMVNRFRERKYAFLAVMVLLFMSLGSLFGLFEETLLMLPMVLSACVAMGFDPVVGFLVSTFATGIGFSVAITNPFTVLYASDIIGADPTKHIFFRFLIFAVYYLIVLGFVFLTAKRSMSQVSAENVFTSAEITATPADSPEGEKKVFIIYTVFLTFAFSSIILFSAIPLLRDIALPLLTGVFLIFGTIAGTLSFGFKKTMKSFLTGIVSALPAVAMIALAFAVKYVLTEGEVLDTITSAISTSVKGKSPFATIMIIFGIILVLEFFISSSTAKAVFVMGVLYGAMNAGSISFSKELLVLIYVFSDGFTNVLFPTSPTLLIGLSLTGQDYFSWLKRSKYLFLTVFLMAFLILGIALQIQY